MKKLIISLIVICFAAFAYAAETTGTVVEVQGTVDIVQGNAVMGKLAKPGTVLSLKDILRTKRKGYAVVKLNDGTDIKIFEKSRLVFSGNGRTKDGYNTELKNGKVLFRVEKMRDVAGDFRIKTPNAVIGVKGTLVGMQQGLTALNMELYNGSLLVQPLLQPVGPSGDPMQGSGGGIGPGGLGGTGEGGLVGQGGIPPVVISPGQGLAVGAGGTSVFPIGGGSLLFPGMPGTVDDEAGAFGGVSPEQGGDGGFGGGIGGGGFAPPSAG